MDISNLVASAGIFGQKVLLLFANESCAVINETFLDLFLTESKIPCVELIQVGASQTTPLQVISSRY